MTHGIVDYYAVLQVHHDAEREVIEAAYRQLMRKYHPDMAGGDAARAAALHDRAKDINQAYAVLANPDTRWTYDRLRLGTATGAKYATSESSSSARRDVAPRSATPPSQVASRPAPQGHAGAHPAEAAYAGIELTSSAAASWLWGPLRAAFAGLSDVYYLLPGPYEWEQGRTQERIAALVIPPVGIGAWALASGRFDVVLGRSPYGFLVAWALLLFLAIPAWSSLPRLILAGVPTALLFAGKLDVVLGAAHVPQWLAWAVLAALSVFLSARLYLFAVLPTAAVCWLLSRLA